MKQVKARVLENRRVITATYLMRLQAPDITAGAQPGQYVMVRCGEDTVLRRPLSVHRVDRDELWLLYEVRGKGTAWLSRLKRGNIIDILGAMGNGFSFDIKAENILLVAGGVGIAPLVYVAQAAVQAGKQTILLVGAADMKHLCPRALLPDGIDVVFATEDGSKGYKGMVTGLLPVYAPTAGQIIACGPLPMYRAMAANQERLGIAGKPVQVSMEMRMGCGVGVCYGCTIRTKSGLKQACKDGPVFELNEIIWDDLARI